MNNTYPSTLCALISCCLTLVMFRNRRKNRSKSFLHWKDGLFFQKFVFSPTSQALREWFYNFHSKCQNSFWTLINCSVGVVTLGSTRKFGPKTFVPVKTANFWIVFLYRTLRSQKNDVITWTILIQVLCVPLSVAAWRWSCSGIGEKIGPNLFFTGKMAFFFKSLCFHQPLRS